MKSKLLLLLLFLGTMVALSAIPTVDENTYIVRPGDQFLIQVVSADTVEAVSPVLPEGRLSLHPVGPSIMVAGMTLHDVKKMATELILKRLPYSYVTVELGESAPTHFHLVGAMQYPGEYISKTPLTLYEALELGKGMLPQASRKVLVERGGENQTYDLRKYLIDGDLSQNPLVQDGDRIEADFAKDYLRVFVNNDTTLTVEYFELDQPMALRDVLLKTLSRYPLSQYSSTRVVRGNETLDLTMDSMVQKGDDIYLATEERCVYVVGYVLNAGKYTYNGPRDVAYYINMAGGYATIGSHTKVQVISPDGTIRNRNTPVRPGDTIRVPESSWFMVRDFITPVSAVAALVLVLTQIF